MNLEVLKHAKDYIEKMANGINPLSGESVSENDLLNNVRISRCLFFVNDILREVLENGGVKKNRNKKVPFKLSRDIINKYEFSDEDLSISKIVKRINDLKIDGNMANLKVSDVCNWLVSIGLLEKTEKNGKKVKTPTDNAKKMGMYIEHRFGLYGEYDIVLYKKEMQEFIIDNFESLLDFIGEINNDKELHNKRY